MDEISDYRQARYFHAQHDPPTFLVISTLGFGILMFFVSIFPAKTINLVYIGVYSLFIGVLIFAIINMGHPFKSPITVGSDPFEEMYKYLKTKKIGSP